MLAELSQDERPLGRGRWRRNNFKINFDRSRF